MTQEQILAELKTRVGQTSLSDRTLTAYIGGSFIPGLNGGEPDDAYLNRHAEVIKSLTGNYSHDVATEVEKFKKDYKPEPPKPDDKPKDEVTKRLEALENQLANEKRLNSLNEVKNGLKAKAEGLKVANKAIWNDVVSSMSIEENATIDTLLTEAKTAYESKLKEYIGDGASPYKGDTTPPKPDTTDIDKFFEQKAAEGKFPKKE